MRLLIRRPLWLLLAALLAAAPAFAEVGDPVTKKAPFDDVRFELGNAVVTRGLAIQLEGNFGKMLDRTGADVGSTKPVYLHAEFIEVCSARFGRMMVEADPTLMGNCPFLLYAYERVDRPGEVVVGFRRLHPGQSAAAREAVAAAEAMLDAIVRDAVK